MTGYPRAPSHAEQALINALLERSFPERAWVLEMLVDTQVTGACPCGCGSVDLSVNPNTSAAELTEHAWIGLDDDHTIRWGRPLVEAMAEVEGVSAIVGLRVARDEAELDIAWFAREGRALRLPRPEELVFTPTREPS